MKRVIAAAALLFAGPLAAHRGHDALTMVSVLPTGEVRVSHRFEADDIEPALSTIAPAAQANLDDPAAIEALVVYLQRNFFLVSERGPIELIPTDRDVGSSQVRIDFVGRTRVPLTRLSVRTQLLRDVYPRQVNQVTVRVGQLVRTITFTDDSAKTISLR